MAPTRFAALKNVAAQYAAAALGMGILVAALLACASYCAGAIFLLSAGEQVAHADFHTIARAWRAASDASSTARLHGSIALALIACIWLPLGVLMALYRRARLRRRS